MGVYEALWLFSKVSTATTAVPSLLLSIEFCCCTRQYYDLRPYRTKNSRCFLHVADTSRKTRFSGALEATDDADLRWRYTLLTAVSLALGDKGDATAASAKAALGLQHAEALALREGGTAEAARGVLNEVGCAAMGIGMLAGGWCAVVVIDGVPTRPLPVTL